MAHQAKMSPAPTAAELEMHRPPTAAELEEMYPTPIEPAQLPWGLFARNRPPGKTCTIEESLKTLPIKDCIREVLKYRTEVVETPTEWIVGGHLLLTHHPLAESPPTGKTSWPGGERDKGYYTLEDAPKPLPWSCLVREGRFEEISYPGNRATLRRIGEADLNVSIILFPHGKDTREHVTLEWMAQRKEHFSFDFPQVLHHHELHGRYFLLVRRVHGHPLWHRLPSMSEQEKEAAQRYLRRIISKELAAFTKHGGRPCAVDGGFLNNCLEKPYDDLYFAHGLLGSSILVGDDNKVVAIINWRNAGFIDYRTGVCRDMQAVEQTLWMSGKP
ncbi:hypothetical protein RB595_000517 [Gaeumannomyces hyphopodioides]